MAVQVPRVLLVIKEKKEWKVNKDVKKHKITMIAATTTCYVVKSMANPHSSSFKRNNDGRFREQPGKEISLFLY